MLTTDVDIDTPKTFNPLNYFPTAIKASNFTNGKFQPHPAGVYFQSIPKDYVSNLSAITYDKAENYGFMKIDFLHLSILEHFKSKQEIRYWMNVEPDWNLFLDKDICSRLFQIGKHHELISKIKPKSVEDLADCIALIRPGKFKLIDLYLKDRHAVRKVLYLKTDDMYFKRAHAIAYAYNVILNLHLIVRKII